MPGTTDSTEKTASLARRKSVLVVDASGESRRHVAAILRGAGFECHEAANGRQALDCLQWAGASLVISDLDMPVMDGFQLISAIRNMPEDLIRPAVVVCSAQLDDPRVFSRPEIAGVASLIFKPVTPLNLLRTVEAILEPQGRTRSGAGCA
jgi:CheY-like chemotaxis protein